jgi:hypothetical protein
LAFLIEVFLFEAFAAFLQKSFFFFFTIDRFGTFLVSYAAFVMELFAFAIMQECC